MAKKRKPERKKNNGGRGRRKPPSPDLSGLPDPRAMEGVMRQLLGGMGAAGPEGPAAQAQAMIYQAFEESSPQRRVALARRALATWSDCADAYVLLAEHAPSLKDALELYEQGVAAGERALGPRMFAENAGHFWGILETRPYMRARVGLAYALWAAGRRDEAVGHLQDMLRLNPNDNQGVRYTLAGFLINLDRDDELARLLEQYRDDGTAAWAYTKALLAFRRRGDTPEARALLQQALKSNQHVPAYLEGRKLPSREQPGFISPGDESEALEYVAGFLAAWKATPGAVDWLRANDAAAGKAKAAPAPAPQPRGPLGFIKEWLKEHLPEGDDTWQADFRPMPYWIEEGGRRVRPWMVLVTDPTAGHILAHDIQEEEPAPALLWDLLVQAMQNPPAGDPHRPAAIQVRADPRWEALRPHFAAIGVELSVGEPLDFLDAMVAEMDEEVFGKPEPSLLDVPGVTPEQVAGFYEAAADFYRQAPWKKIGYESALQIECALFDGGPWYAVVMGQSGLTMGLTLYEDLRLLKKLFEGRLSDEQNARLTVATTVTFNEEMDMPAADVDAARRYGWKVARRDAYPNIFHKERGLSMRPPLAWELQLMEAALRAVPGFVDRHAQDDPTREEVTVPTAKGEVTLGLSWVVE